MGASAAAYSQVSKSGMPIYAVGRSEAACAWRQMTKRGQILTPEQIERRRESGRRWRRAHGMEPRVKQSEAQYAERARQRKVAKIASGLCGIPTCQNPVRPDRKTCVEHGRRDVDSTGKYFRADVAKGICGHGGCRDSVAEGHTMCDSHLLKMREDARKRTADRKSKGLCRSCAAPTLFGQTHCIPCGAKYRKGPLPQPVRSALSRYRQIEALLAKDTEFRAEQDRIRRKLHLLNPRYQNIMTLLWLGENKRTLQEVGDILKVTRERIRQIEAKCMKVIETGIPIPSGNTKWKAQLDAMETGNSIVITKGEYVGVKHCAKKLGVIVTVRSLPDGNYRMWVLEKPNAKGNGK